MTVFECFQLGTGFLCTLITIITCPHGSVFHQRTDIINPKTCLLGYVLPVQIRPYSCHSFQKSQSGMRTDLAGSIIWYTTPWGLVGEAKAVARMYSSPSSSSPNERMFFTLCVPTSSPVHTLSSPIHSSCCCHSPEVLFSRRTNSLLRTEYESQTKNSIFTTVCFCV